ncbi:hypothetical protein DXG01_004717 [Tephrocybe rancida]|nr:hypothetical protein DXG01_004717 [Tephrocybe rancida]
MQQLLDRFLALDEIGMQLKHLTLSEKDWDQVTAMLAFLQWPHCIQQVMSKDANLVLAGALPIMECFLEGWECLAEAEPRLKPLIKSGLHRAQTYYSCMDNTDA